MNKTFLVLILAGLAVTVSLTFLKFDKNNNLMSDKLTDKLTSPDILGSTSNQPTSPITEPTLNPTPTISVPTISASNQSMAILHTSAGDITIKFNSGSTPNTIANFIKLSQTNFYNATIFHRVIKGFMIQGGDPKGDGTGGPGYTFADEPFEGEYTRGTVAMANSGPNTNGSQFFIMHQDAALQKDYVIFGKVMTGMETVDKIAQAPTIPDGEGSRPVNPVSIKTIELISGEGVN